MSLLKKTFLLCFFYPAVSILCSYQCFATDFSTDELKSTAVKFISKQIPSVKNIKTKVRALPLSSHVTTKICHSPLISSTSKAPPFNRQITVRIKCKKPENWSLYVHIKIEELYPVFETTKLIAKGDVFSPEDIKLSYKSKHFIRAKYVDNLKHIIGSRSKRNLRESSVISFHHLCMVCKGDNITIFATTANLKVKTSGVAMQDGNIGERIRVKNQKAGKIIHARVKDINSVEVKI